MASNNKSLTLIGCGNMGSAILQGIARSGLVSPSSMICADVNKDAQARLAKAVGCGTAASNRDAVANAQTVILAVKPQYLDGVLEEISTALAPETLVISIAAGVSIDHLESFLGAQCRIVRVMPNLPAMVGEGMSSVSPNARAQAADDAAYVKQLFNSFGQAEIVPEHLIDAVVAVSGSSPAYVCLFIEALADAGVAEGMTRTQAYTFAEQAVLGTAKYLLETGEHPASLKDKVCSPAGTTIDAVAVLEADGFRTAIIDAARTAALRNRTM